MGFTNDQMDGLLVGGLERIGTKDGEQGVGLADDCTAAMDQSLVLIGRSQRQGLADLVLELLDSGGGGEAREYQGAVDTD